MARARFTGAGPPLGLTLFLAALIFLAPVSCSDDTEPELPRLIENQYATVLIQAASGSHGTGVAVSHCGYILTNAHVVESASSNPFQVSVVGYADTLEATVVATDEDHDLAIIRVNYAFQRAAIVETREQTIHDGNESYAVGFPHDMGRAVSRGYIRQRHFAATSPQAPPIARDATMLDQRQEPGTSGSGIYAVRDGHLIGLMSNNLWAGNSPFQMRPNPIVVPVRLIRPFLEAHNVPYCRPPPTISERIVDWVQDVLQME